MHVTLTKRCKHFINLLDASTLRSSHKIAGRWAVIVANCTQATYAGTRAARTKTQKGFPFLGCKHMFFQETQKTFSQIIQDCWIGCLPLGIAELTPYTWMRIWLAEWSHKTANKRVYQDSCCGLVFLGIRKVIGHTHPRTMSVSSLNHYALMAALKWVGEDVLYEWCWKRPLTSWPARLLHVWCGFLKDIFKYMYCLYFRYSLNKYKIEKQKCFLKNVWLKCWQGCLAKSITSTLHIRFLHSCGLRAHGSSYYMVAGAPMKVLYFPSKGSIRQPDL